MEAKYRDEKVEDLKKLLKSNTKLFERSNFGKTISWGKTPGNSSKLTFYCKASSVIKDMTNDPGKFLLVITLERSIRSDDSLKNIYKFSMIKKEKSTAKQIQPESTSSKPGCKMSSIELTFGKLL